MKVQWHLTTDSELKFFSSTENQVTSPSTNDTEDTQEAQQSLSANISSLHDTTTSQQSLTVCNEYKDIYSMVKAAHLPGEHFQVPDMDDEDKLIFETRDIQAKFNNLFTKIHMFITADKKVTVSAFVLFLEGVPGYGGNSLFHTEMSDLHEATDMTNVFRIVKRRCSWFNHLFLADIIDVYCKHNNRVKKDYTDYRSHFKKYCEHRVVKCPLRNGFGKGGKKDKKVLIRVDRKWEEIRIEELEEVLSTLAHELNIPRCTLHLISAENQCVQLTLLVPSYIPDTIFFLTTKQEIAMRERGVTYLQCGTYYFFCQVFHICRFLHTLFSHIDKL